MSKKQSRKKPASKRAKRTSGSLKNGRLGPGELDKLVLTYMRRHKQGGSHSPSAVAKGIERSSGAVANCLARLERGKKVRLVQPKPRKYELAEAKKK